MMFTPRTLLSTALLSASFGIGTLRAEVRLLRPDEGRTPKVRITVGEHGAWEPAGRIDSTVLNPLGALRGDGAPAVAVANGLALVAWTDATTSATVLAVGDRSWRVGTPIPGAKPASVPRVAPAGRAFLLVRTNAAGAIEAAIVETEGRVLPAHAIGQGEVLNLAVVGDSFHVITLDPTGDLTVIVLGITVPDPQPSPYIFRTVLLASRGELGGHIGGSLSASGISVSSPRSQAVTDGPNTLHTAPAVERLSGTDDAHANGAVTWRWRTQDRDAEASPGEVVVLESARPGRSPAVLVAWWLDSTTLQFVELHEDGVGALQSLTGRGAFSPSLVREALRRAIAD